MDTLSRCGCLPGCSSGSFPLSSPEGLRSCFILTKDWILFDMKSLDCCSRGNSHLNWCRPGSLTSPPQLANLGHLVSGNQAVSDHPDKKKLLVFIFLFFRDGDLLLYLVTPRRRIWPMGHRPIFSQTSVHFLRLFSNKKLNLFVKILPSNCKLEHKLRSNLKLLCFKFQVTQKQSIVSERIRVSRHLQMLSLSS